MKQPSKNSTPKFCTVTVNGHKIFTTQPLFNQQLAIFLESRTFNRAFEDEIPQEIKMRANRSKMVPRYYNDAFNSKRSDFNSRMRRKTAMGSDQLKISPTASLSAKKSRNSK